MNVIVVVVGEGILVMGERRAGAVIGSGSALQNRAACRCTGDNSRLIAVATAPPPRR